MRVEFEIDEKDGKPIVRLHFEDYKIYSTVHRLLVRYTANDLKISTTGSSTGWVIVLTLKAWLDLRDFERVFRTLEIAPRIEEVVE